MTTRPIGVAALVLVAFGLLGPGAGHAFRIFDGDPVDSSSGRAYTILPGVPLILPQPDGRFRPPIVDASTIGDIDVLIRAGSPMVGPTIPAPSAVPTTAVAGGQRVAGGTEVPFTVIASDGDAATAYGNPLPGPEMDGMPVVVFAFADLDGDGFVGPTDADAAGASDNARERQESDFPVGRQVAIFENGVARGTVAIWKGAPASAGGLRVMLTAAAYVGPFLPSFFSGNVPDGPGVATLVPFFPRFDPDRVIEGNASQPASPESGLSIEFESAFAPPVADPELGTPFALPTDGSSPTIDRADVLAGPMTGVRFVQPSSASGFPPDPALPLPLFRGAGGVLLEPLASIALRDDGPGRAASVQLVPVDVLDDVTDPSSGASVTLLAGPGLAIVTPDADGDPTRETIALGSAAGTTVSLDDAGGAGDSGTLSTLAAVVDGAAVDTVTITLTPGDPDPPPPTSTTTTTTTATTTTSPPPPPDPAGPTIQLAKILGDPRTFVVGCPARKTLLAVVSDPDGDASGVTANLALNGRPLTDVELREAPPDPSLPPGQVFDAAAQIPLAETGVLDVSFIARDTAGNGSTPVALSFPVVTTAPPVVSAVSASPTTITAFTRQVVTFSALVADDCGVLRVVLELDRGRGFRRFARLRDNGRWSDVTAGDGLFTRAKRMRRREVGTLRFRAVATNRLLARAVSDPVVLPVASP